MLLFLHNECQGLPFGSVCLHIGLIQVSLSTLGQLSVITFVFQCQCSYHSAITQKLMQECNHSSPLSVGNEENKRDMALMKTSLHFLTKLCKA